MKPHKYESSDSIWGAFRTADCPVGCTVCSYDRERVSARFSRISVSAGQSLPEAPRGTHRILFLRSGSVRVDTGPCTAHRLTGGTCIFLARDRCASAVAEEDCQAVVLDFNNRIMFCHNDILAKSAIRNTRNAAAGPVLKTTPEIEAFLRCIEAELESPTLDIPCYHIVKEHELFLIMYGSYRNAGLSRFFRDILKPRDDFELFVRSNRHRAESVAELARLAHMSESSFVRRFRETFRESYHTWSVKQRAVEIEQAIRNGMTDNGDLVDRFGFKSYLSFYRFCQRHLHASPTDLKKRYNTKEQSIEEKM